MRAASPVFPAIFRLPPSPHHEPQGTQATAPSGDDIDDMMLVREERGECDRHGPGPGRAHRLEKEEKRLAKENLVLPLLVRTLQRLTVRSVKFIRWLRVQLFLRPHHEPAIAALRQLYAVL